MQNQNKFVGNSLSLAPPPPPPPLLPLYMCLQYSSFWNRKAKSYGSKLQVTPTKLQVTSTKLQVTRSKLTSLTAETNKL